MRLQQDCFKTANCARVDLNCCYLLVSFTSQGSIDNATGVAVALQLAKSIAERDNKFSYRILLAGSEESGLRGSRAHVARLSLEEFDKIIPALF